MERGRFCTVLHFIPHTGCFKNYYFYVTIQIQYLFGKMNAVTLLLTFILN